MFLGLLIVDVSISHPDTAHF